MLHSLRNKSHLEGQGGKKLVVVVTVVVEEKVGSICRAMFVTSVTSLSTSLRTFEVATLTGSLLFEDH